MPEILSLLPHLFIFLIFYISLGSYIFILYFWFQLILFILLSAFSQLCPLRVPSVSFVPLWWTPINEFFFSILLHSTFSPLQDVVPSSTCTFPTPLQENPHFSLHFTFGFWKIPVRYEDLGSRYPSITWVLLLHAPLSWQRKHSWSIRKRVYVYL